ncbi:hypothetical protein L596_028910 [Steinernema carpocapsae]|uniref:Peptidase M12A domain-containing protein n=1 Tax=Steinernema carpocapsae TaxID=34508 RepID=A0A4U5LZQ2_STECR|nr:hypothetical protein L596_028910 [Steinernema carpocapsae]
MVAFRSSRFCILLVLSIVVVVDCTISRRSFQSSSESVESDPVRQWNQIQTSHIEHAFSNKKNFACPRIKDRFHTGSTADLSPEDIEAVAVMGDAISVCG